MKYGKMLGLLAFAAAALMAFAGTASATLEDENGALVVGSKIGASSSGSTSLTGTITVTCQKSTVSGKVIANGATSAAVTVESLSFTECGNHTVTAVPQGAFEHFGTIEINSKNQVFSTGAEVTVLLHSALLGTLHCIYRTSNTDIGNFNEGTGAVLFIGSKSIPRLTTEKNHGCGEHATWEGTYLVTTPHTLNNN